MRIVASIISLSCLFVCCTAKGNNTDIGNKVSRTEAFAEPVLICHSAFATKYHHDRECKGLDNCTREIVEVEKLEADSLGYSLCGYEVPQ